LLERIRCCSTRLIKCWRASPICLTSSRSERLQLQGEHERERKRGRRRKTGKRER
jgi:hypothetical protein